MQLIKKSKHAIHLYCDKPFIQRMSKINIQPIKNQFFFQDSKNIVINMHMLPEDKDSYITLKNNTMDLYFCTDTFSVIRLISETLTKDNHLYTSELGEYEFKNKVISLYLLLRE